jgi:hypothetical protein
VTEFKPKIIDEGKNVDEIKCYLQLVMENNELMLNLADNFLSYEAFNEEKFKSSFIVKKIEYHMQEIERLFELIVQKHSVLDMKETHQLLTLVKSLFGSRYHRRIGLKLRSFDLQNCLRWVAKQVNHKFLTCDVDAEKCRIGLQEFMSAKMEQRIKFLAIETLCEYNNFEGRNTDYMVDRLIKIEMNYDDNMDLHAVFHVLEIFARQQSVPEKAIEWLWLHIIEICGAHYTHQYLSGRLIGALRVVAHLSKNFHDMTSRVVMLFTSFAQICARPEYGPLFTVKFIHQFKYFHQVSSTDCSLKSL